MYVQLHEFWIFFYSDNLPRNSSTVDMFEVIAGSSLLENLGKIEKRDKIY